MTDKVCSPDNNVLSATLGEFRIHELLACFPSLSDADAEALERDIAEHGQLVPLTVTADGTLVDGRARYDVCHNLGRQPLIAVLPADLSELEIVSRVFSLNSHRRHLTVGQPAMTAVKMTPLVDAMRERWTNSSTLFAAKRTRDIVGEWNRVSGTSVQEALYLLRYPETAQAVWLGHKSLHAAIQQLRRPRTQGIACTRDASRTRRGAASTSAQ